jgi:Ca2+-binding EF-hand superfamily protein
MKLLKALRESLVAGFSGDGTPGSKVREIFLFLLPFDHDGKGWVYVEEVARSLSENYGIEWGKPEKQALLRAFDHDRCHGIPPGRMRIREFMDMIRSPLSPRKNEIVEILFDILDSSRCGFITVQDILSRWQGPEKILDSFLQSLEIYNGHAANLMQSVELREESYGVRVFSIFYKDFVTENGEDTEMFEQFIEDCWRME